MLKKLMKKKGFTLIELMIVVAIIGILAAIAIPNFVRFQARSKQGEAKTNLKALFTAQKAWYGEKDQYLTDGSIIGWNPEPGNRYAYGLGGSDCWNRPGNSPGSYNCVTNDTARFPPALNGYTAPAVANFATLGVSGTCPQCQFAGGAEGNLDTDGQYDLWYIASQDGSSAGLGGACGEENTRVTAGVSFNGKNDVSCD